MYETTDYAAQYRSFNDDELLALWAERNQLADAARGALRDEIKIRQLSKEADTPEQDAEAVKEFSPPINIYGGITLLFWWVREMWLRFQTRNGVSVSARIDSTCQTKRRWMGRGARAEIRYSYEFQGDRHSGRTTRDFIFNRRAADALSFGHKRGEIISVRVDPESPTRSYSPSGFGWIEPLLYGSSAALAWAFWIALIIAEIYWRIGRYR